MTYRATAALIATVAASTSFASDRTDAAAGAELFATYCATCHGVGAKGDGPTAELMTISPADLTRLSADAGGRFPTERVVRQIDGRDPLLAHGGPMPMYGPFFDGEDATMKTPAGQPVMTSAPMVALVTWLQTIQEE